LCFEAPAPSRENGAFLASKKRHWTKRLRREMGERPHLRARIERSSSLGEF
jgi:hypothetical protein